MNPALPLIIQCGWLEGKHVAFGRVTEERQDFLSVLENVGTKSGKTKKAVETVNNYNHIIIYNVDFIVQSQIIIIEHAKLISY